jgi:transposase
MFETKTILVLKMVFSIKERVFIYEIYLLTNSCDRVREEFTDKFGKKGPKNVTIIDIKNKFEETGSVTNRKHNRRRHVLTPEKLNKLKESLEQNPRESVRQRSGNLQISKSSIVSEQKF